MLAMAGVAVRRLLRDRSNIFFVFIFPLLLVMLFGLQFAGGEVSTVGVATLGGPVDGAAALGAAEELDDVEVVVFEDEPSLVAAVEVGAVDGGLVLLDDEVRWVTRPGANVVGTRLRAEAAIVHAAADERVVAAVVAAGVAEADTARAALAGLGDAAVAGAGAARVTTTTLGAGTSVDEFAGLGQFDLGASSQLLLFVFITSLTGSAGIVQARRWGVVDRVLAGPTSERTVLAGLALGQLTIALAQAAIIVLGTVLLFDVRWGDPLASGTVIVAFAAVAAAAGVLLGSVLRTEQQAGALGVPIALSLAALGGSMLPLELFSGPMETLSRFTPHAWANLAFAEIVRRDAGLADVLGPVGVLLGFAVVLGVAATVLLRRSIRSG